MKESQVFLDTLNNVTNELEPHLPSEPRIFSLYTKAADFYRHRDKMEEAKAAIRDDGRLSQEGRQQELTTLNEQYRPVLEQHRDAFTSEYEAVAASVTKAFEPAPPVQDEALLELRLQSARQDARMLLDPKESAMLPTSLIDVATAGDEYMTWLVLKTNWADNYLTARSGNKQEWNHLKQEALPLMLGEKEAALKSAWDKYANIATMNRNAFERSIKNLPSYTATG